MSYEEACKCAGKSPDGFTVDESEEESMRRRFGSNYVETGIGLIRRNVRIGSFEEDSSEFAKQKSRMSAPRGKSGNEGFPGKPGITSKPSSFIKQAEKTCMCGSWGRRGANGKKS